MQRTLPVSIALLLAVVCVPIAEAGPIIYFENYRSLNVNGTMFETTDTGSWLINVNGNPNGFHNSFIGESGLDAAAHPFDRVRARGEVRVNRIADADASTDLFTSFLLDSRYTAHLDAFVSARLDGYAEGFLFNQSTQTMLAQAITENGTARLSYAGILEPGVYSYYLLARLNSPAASNDHNAGFGGDLTLTPFTPVPEPASITLFGIGLAATAWRRRRQQ